MGETIHTDIKFILNKQTSAEAFENDKKSQKKLEHETNQKSKKKLQK